MDLLSTRMTAVDAAQLHRMPSSEPIGCPLALPGVCLVRVTQDGGVASARSVTMR